MCWLNYPPPVSSVSYWAQVHRGYFRLLRLTYSPTLLKVKTPTSCLKHTHSLWPGRSLAALTINSTENKLGIHGATEMCLLFCNYMRDKAFGKWMNASRAKLLATGVETKLAEQLWKPASNVSGNKPVSGLAGTGDIPFSSCRWSFSMNKMLLLHGCGFLLPSVLSKASEQKPTKAAAAAAGCPPCVGSLPYLKIGLD